MVDPNFFLSCFILYIAATILFGWWMTRKKQSGEDFLLGGRSLPLFLTLGTTLATMVGTGSSIGAVGKGFQNGWAGSLFGIGGALGIFVTAWLFANARKHKFMTMAEEISSYVGANRMVLNTIGILTLLANIGWLGAHIIGGAAYLTHVTELHPVYAKCLIAIGFGVYSAIGGYKAVVWTDTLQALVLFVGFIATGIFAMEILGGWEGLKETNAAISAKTDRNILNDLSLILVIGVGVLGNPTFRQRIYSGNSVENIRKAFIFSGILYLAFAAIPSIIGMAAWKSFPELSNSNADLAFPKLATETLPVALGVLVILAGLSATLSSASSDAIAAVAVLVRDVFKLFFGRTPHPAQVVPVSRVSLVITSVLALAMALSAKTILDYIQMMISLFIVGMSVTGILGKIWSRYNAWGAMTTLISASLTALYIQYNPSFGNGGSSTHFLFNLETNKELLNFWGNPVIPVFVVSTVAGIIASLLTKPDNISQEEAISILAKERSEMEESPS